MKSVKESLLERRSIRRYERQPIEPEKLNFIYEAIRNAPTSLMKELHYGEGYQYAHDTEEKLTTLQCLPDALLDRKYYVPTRQGREGRIQERMEQIEAWQKQHRHQ